MENFAYMFCVKKVALKYPTKLTGRVNTQRMCPYELKVGTVICCVCVCVCVQTV